MTTEAALNLRFEVPGNYLVAVRLAYPDGLIHEEEGYLTVEPGKAGTFDWSWTRQAM